MSTIEGSVDMEGAVRPAYDQWTQCEELSRFLERVESMTQVGDDPRRRWVTEIDGVRRDWDDAEITVMFHRLDGSKTAVMLQLDVELEGGLERVHDALEIIDRRTASDGRRFTDVEKRERVTGELREDVGQTW